MDKNNNRKQIFFCVMIESRKRSSCLLWMNRLWYSPQLCNFDTQPQTTMTHFEMTLWQSIKISFLLFWMKGEMIPLSLSLKSKLGSPNWICSKWESSIIYLKNSSSSLHLKHFYSSCVKKLHQKLELQQPIISYN